MQTNTRYDPIANMAPASQGADLVSALAKRDRNEEGQAATKSVIDETAVVKESFFSAGEYNISLTDKDCARIGRAGGPCFDVPRGHAWYDRLIESTTLAEVVSHYNELVEAFA